jgi:HAD superfamily hydrolase (TIGR01490 family)
MFTATFGRVPTGDMCTPHTSGVHDNELGRVQAVRLPQPADQRLVLFDLDRTLIPGSCLVTFGRALVRRRMITRRSLAGHALAAGRFKHRGLSDDRVDSIRSQLLSVVAGHEYDALAAVALDLGPTLAATVFSTARHVLDLHLAAGDFCVVLTAAPQELADSVVQAIGAHRAVGTRLEVADGALTGRVLGAFCHGPGKLVRLAEDVGPVDWRRTSAYGDSASDVAVLERAARPVAVNPDRRLRALAVESGWSVLRFS